jgi:hypothetical protein
LAAFAATRFTASAERLAARFTTPVAAPAERLAPRFAALIERRATDRTCLRPLAVCFFAFFAIAVPPAWEQCETGELGSCGGKARHLRIVVEAWRFSLPRAHAPVADSGNNQNTLPRRSACWRSQSLPTIPSTCSRRGTWGVASIACRQLKIPYDQFLEIINGPLKKQAALIRAEVTDYVTVILLRRARRRRRDGSLHSAAQGVASVIDTTLIDANGFTIEVSAVVLLLSALICAGSYWAVRCFGMLLRSLELDVFNVRGSVKRLLWTEGRVVELERDRDTHALSLKNVLNRIAALEAPK